MFRALLTSRLQAAFTAAGIDLPAGFTPGVVIASDTRFGDYQSNAAMVLAKQLKTNPRALAEQIKAALQVEDLCEKITVDGPGFLDTPRLQLGQLVGKSVELGWKVGDIMFADMVLASAEGGDGRTDALGELSRLYWMLVNNPDVVVEICSHTDARGSNDYNKRLSQRRADAIVNWLIQKGIERRRLQARGYGEERPVNDCKDGVACSEEAYQVNRRTEFRILNQSLGQAH